MYVLKTTEIILENFQHFTNHIMPHVFLNYIVSCYVNLFFKEESWSL